MAAVVSDPGENIVKQNEQVFLNATNLDEILDLAKNHDPTSPNRRRKYQFKPKVVRAVHPNGRDNVYTFSFDQVYPTFSLEERERPGKQYLKEDYKFDPTEIKITEAPPTDDGDEKTFAEPTIEEVAEALDQLAISETGSPTEGDRNVTGGTAERTEHPGDTPATTPATSPRAQDSHSAGKSADDHKEFGSAN